MEMKDVELLGNMEIGVIFTADNEDINVNDFEKKLKEKYGDNYSPISKEFFTKINTNISVRCNEVVEVFYTNTDDFNFYRSHEFPRFEEEGCDPVYSLFEELGFTEIDDINYDFGFLK